MQVIAAQKRKDKQRRHWHCINFDSIYWKGQEVYREYQAVATEDDYR